MNFNAEQVEKRIEEKTTKSPELCQSIKVPLSIIFRKCYESGILPEAWKKAHVTPIHKKGSKVVPGNYRPVSLTSVIGNMMESIVKDQLVEHMMLYNLFCDAQHGFVPRCSCMTQLLVTMELWSEILDSGAPIDAIYLDFRKAFDSVPHQRLTRKLKAYGVTDKPLRWIRDFLTGRN